MINLVSAPFLPMVLSDGKPYRLSIRDTFDRAADITDLALPPHERIAVLRLLLCISQAALDDDLELDEAIPGCRVKLASAATEYLKNWEPSFELLGDGPRFLQLRTRKSETTSASKLDLALASGNNPTLLDHGALSPRQFSAQELALSLIAFLNFSPLIGRGYLGRGPAVESNMRHTFLHGTTLLDTLTRNLLSYEALSDRGIEMGRPVWEKMPELPKPDPEFVRNATETYLGRLCPLSRAVWLLDGSSIILDNGLTFPGPDEILEPSAATRLIKVSATQEKLITLAVKSDRAVWRELDAVLAETESAKRPLHLRNANLFPESATAIWTGGLTTDFKAKVEDAASSLFAGETAIPRGLLNGSDDALERYRSAVEAAGSWAYAISRATGEYSKGLHLDKDPFRAPAQTDFWTRLEQHLPRLFAFALDPSQSVSKKPETRGFSFSSANPYNPADWHTLAARTARACFRRACDPDRGRNYFAFVQGEQKLWPVNPQKKEIAAYRKELANRSLA